MAKVWNTKIMSFEVQGDTRNRTNAISVVWTGTNESNAIKHEYNQHSAFSNDK